MAFREDVRRHLATRIRRQDRAECRADLALARHIFEHGVEGRFYSQVRRYHHEGGKVYWSITAAPEGATLINRCDEGQTYEARLAAGSLPQ